MKKLLTLIVLAAVIFVAQPAHAQQQDTAKDTTSMQNMEMMQDSTMMQSMMKKMMNDPQMRQKMMRMMQNMQSDSVRSDKQGMTGGNMSGMCMKMCMNMMGGDMDMNKMPKNKESQDSTKMKKSEG